MKRKKILIILTILIIIALIIILLMVYFSQHQENGNNENTLNVPAQLNIVNEEVNAYIENVQSPNTIAEENTNSTNSSSNTTLENSSTTSSSNSNNSSPNSHTHSWKNHTSQKWVSNIVTVVDTPAQTIEGAQLYTLHSDGKWYGDGQIYWFENGFTHDDLKSILINKIKNEGYIGNYVNRYKTVPAVTHEEDQGHYETYVDYQYCDCGAIK